MSVDYPARPGNSFWEDTLPFSFPEFICIKFPSTSTILTVKSQITKPQLKMSVFVIWANRLFMLSKCFIGKTISGSC